jgi:predicted nicotinamide N-methyase
MTTQTGRALADLERKVGVPDISGLDRLRLTRVPLAPEIRLHLAEDAIVWWARMEAEAGERLVAPFWASAWAGGQAVARYVLDHPQTVSGRRVLDLASGSGMVAIAAGLAGAKAVIANDIDPYAIAAITMNAKTNGVDVQTSLADLLDGDGGDADVVLAGDVLYGPSLADRMLPFLHRAAARGARVIVGDPERGYLPPGLMQVLATYVAPTAGAFADSELTQIKVLELRA